MTEPTRYLSTADAAKVTGLGKSSLERLRTAGGGPVFFRATPRRVLYAADELDKWLRAKAHRSTSEYDVPARAA